MRRKKFSTPWMKTKKWSEIWSLFWKYSKCSSCATQNRPSGPDKLNNHAFYQVSKSFHFWEPKNAIEIVGMKSNNNAKRKSHSSLSQDISDCQAGLIYTTDVYSYRIVTQHTDFFDITKICEIGALLVFVNTTS